MCVVGPHGQLFALFCGLAEDFLRKAVPAGFPRRGQVVQAGGNVAVDGQGGYLGNQARGCGGAYLVCHYVQLRLALGQAQHGFHEVVATGAVYPAGAEYKVFAAALGDGLVAFEFGLAVYAERAGGAVFLPGFGAVAGVYVVAAVVHQEGTLLCRVFGQLFG